VRIGTAEVIAANGLPPAPHAKAPRKKPAMVDATWDYRPDLSGAGAGAFVFTIPVEAPSLANDRDWKVRNRCAGAHRKAVSKALGPWLTTLAAYAVHYHRGGVLLVRVVRLGGRKLDRGANLPAALKYVEDGVALMLGADDGDPRWRCEFDQEPGGPVGVRVELSRWAAGPSAPLRSSRGSGRVARG
jgi:hypothetical protein